MAKNPSKVYERKEVERVVDVDYGSSIEDLLELCNNNHDATVFYETYYHNYDEREDCRIKLRWYVMETDEEYNKRIEDFKKREDKEYKQYLKLKEKYGDIG